MTDEHSRDDSRVRLSDDTAHRLVARAIELDQSSDLGLAVHELREAAREVGISVHAFDAALRELPVSPPSADATQRIPPGNIVRRLWTRMRGRQPGRPNAGDAVVSNAIAAALSWVLILLFTRTLMGLGWQGMEGGILLGCVLGVGIARKLRARVLELGLMGMVAFQAAELAMHLLFGIRAVQSGPTHFAVMIAGILGVVLARATPGTQHFSGHVPGGAASAGASTTSSTRMPDEPHSLIRALRLIARFRGMRFLHHALPS